MLPPSVAIECSSSGGGRSGESCGRRAVERAVHAAGVVTIPEFAELPRQVHGVPEEYAIKVLTPDSSDQPSLAGDGVIEHPPDREPVNVCHLDAEADNAAGDRGRRRARGSRLAAAGTSQPTRARPPWRQRPRQNTTTSVPSSPLPPKIDA